jgi:hypothetical protein
MDPTGYDRLTEFIVQQLDNVTEQARKSALDPANLQRIQETYELFLEYHKFGYHQQGSSLEVARFPVIPKETLDQLTAVCIEFCTPDTWRKAIELLQATSARELQAESTTEAIGRLLYRTGASEEHLEKANVLLEGRYELQERTGLIDNIVAAYENARDTDE